MAGKGGRRPGAGRPRKEDAIRRRPGPAILGEEAFRDALPALAKVALRLALDGDKSMVIYCINRALGSPVQPIDLDVKRTADRLASATGADPEFLIRRAQQLAEENAGGATG